MRLLTIFGAWSFLFLATICAEPRPAWTELSAAAALPQQNQQPGEVRLDIQPKRAAVFLDDAYAGHGGDFGGRFHAMLVAPGKHQLKVTLAGYRSYETEINPVANEKSRMKIVLEKEGNSPDKP